MQRTQVGPPTWYPVEQQDQRHFGVSSLHEEDGIPQLITLSLKSAGAPYLNQGQNIGNRAKAATIVPNGTRAAPQTAVSANIPLAYTWLMS